LLRYEDKVLENYGELADVNVVTKIAWDNMPPLTEVKGFAETDVGLTLILEGEKFIFFAKEQTSGQGTDFRLKNWNGNEFKSARGN
jgi:hypothetical protein